MWQSWCERRKTCVWLLWLQRTIMYFKFQLNLNVSVVTIQHYSRYTQHTPCICCHHSALLWVHTAHTMYLLSPFSITLGTHSTHHVSVVTIQHYFGYTQHTPCICCHHSALLWVHTVHTMYLLSPFSITLGTHSTHHVSVVTIQHYFGYTQYTPCICRHRSSLSWVHTQTHTLSDILSQ